MLSQFATLASGMATLADLAVWPIAPCLCDYGRCSRPDTTSTAPPLTVTRLEA